MFAGLFMKTNYLQVFLGNCADKIVDKKMMDYLDEKLFETDKDFFLIFGKKVL